MENCAICQKEINHTPHVECAQCHATVCYEHAKDQPKCPACGFKG